MKQQRKVIYGLFACVAILVIISNGNYAVNSVRSGIELCLRTVIPALLPFLVLSGIINSCFLGHNFRLFLPIRRLCRISGGTESILLIGLISGYPVGAQLVADAYANGNISNKDARRMLGFCSNAGPALIFGMLSTTFTKPIVPWILWGIHVISALLVGWVLPGNTDGVCVLRKNEPVSVAVSLHKAIGNMVTVCGWVILFRLFLDFCNCWFMRLFPAEIQVLIFGMFELTNGCIMLQQLTSEATRFVLASVILAFGGLCVAMQTVSVTKNLGTGFYIPGKLLQTLFSVTLSCILQTFIFPYDSQASITKLHIILLVVSTTLTVYLFQRKKVVAFAGTMLYNRKNKSF